MYRVSGSACVSDRMGTTEIKRDGTRQEDETPPGGGKACYIMGVDLLQQVLD